MDALAGKVVSDQNEQNRGELLMAEEEARLLAQYEELSEADIQEDESTVDNYDEAEGPFDFGAFDNFLEEISDEAPAAEAETVPERDGGKIQQDAPTISTDDAGGLKQQIAFEGDRKSPTIGRVQKQGGKAVGTSDFMDGFTADPNQDLFAHTSLSQLEEQAYDPFAKHENAIGSITADISGYGKEGSRFQADNASNKPTQELRLNSYREGGISDVSGAQRQEAVTPEDKAYERMQPILDRMWIDAKGAADQSCS